MPNKRQTRYGCVGNALGLYAFLVAVDVIPLDLGDLVPAGSGFFGFRAAVFSLWMILALMIAAQSALALVAYYASQARRNTTASRSNSRSHRRLTPNDATSPTPPPPTHHSDPLPPMSLVQESEP